MKKVELYKIQITPLEHSNGRKSWGNNEIRGEKVELLKIYQ